jgi:sulfite reductase (NADPH) hemoprotein beta-component
VRPSILAAFADRAALGVHDIGLRLVRDDAGGLGFAVWAGGGQGRTPRVAAKLRDFVEAEELLGYLSAILRVYNLHGRRDNKYKARIKILVESLGPEAFAREVEAEYARLGNGALRIPREEIARVGAFFPEPAPDHRPAERADEPAFDAWAARSLKPHKVAGLTSVVISLKPRGQAPGDMTADQMDALADLADDHAGGEIRVTKEQNLVLPHVARADAVALWRGLQAAGLAHANAGQASDIVACPGLDYCNLANARSIPLAEAISERVHETGLDAPAGEVTIKISGCINACGHHHVANIGLLGVDKRGEEVYQLTLGGIADGNAEIGRILGPALTASAAVDAVETVLRAYLNLRREGERFIDTLRRTGPEPFKEAVYAH